MYVIGTAGHVDHGKSTLVQVLTGIDPDRLREEKERGMTIDLGFAWLLLPNGNEVSIVDVPGHERFVNNMLAGIGGIDLALLVVAADESVMPQTKEHLAILDLIGITRGVVAITKRDLVDDDWLELVLADVDNMLRGSSLEGAPVMAVSASTGEGIPELISIIDDQLRETELREDLGRPRLPIDRSFTVSGFGTVTTGTLIDGVLTVGQEVEVLPFGRMIRVRGLQTHRQKVERVIPGTRVAVNLSGIGQEEIGRGDVLTNPGWLKPTTAMDVRLKIITDSPRSVRHNMYTTVHTGSSETVARVRLLDKLEAEPGECVWAQLKMDRPIVGVRGDYFVIRSSRTTLGGGNIVDPHAGRHKRNHLPTLNRLSVMEKGSVREILLNSIQIAEPAEFLAIVEHANLQQSVTCSELVDMYAEKLIIVLGPKGIGPGKYIYTADGWSLLSKRAANFLEGYHSRFPLRKGVPKEELRNRLGMLSQVYGDALLCLEKDGVLLDDGPTVRLPGHVRTISDFQQIEVDAYKAQLEASPYSPPTNAPIDEDLLNILLDNGEVVRVSETVVFTESVYREMVDKVSDYIDKNGEVTVGDVRDMFKTSRKYALALLDHMDQHRVTRRVGDGRVLR